MKDYDIVHTHGAKATQITYILNKIYKYAVTLEYVPHNIIADIEKKEIEDLAKCVKKIKTK